MEKIDHLDRPEEVKVFPVALKWGLIFGLVSVVWAQISLMLGLTSFDQTETNVGTSALSSVIGFAIVVVAMVFAVRDIKTAQGGYISFGKAFGSAFLASMVIALLSTLYMLVYFYVIDPELLATIQENAIEGMEDSGMSDEQIEQQSGMMSMFTSPTFFALMGFFSSAIIYAIIALIVSAVMKKDRAF